MIVLGIETSCDETCVSLVKNGKTVLSNSIASQIKIHSKYGGVVPDIASRQHLKAIGFIYDNAVRESGLSLSDVDMIAVTKGPGLVIALLVGICFAKGLAASRNIPLVGINHIYAHMFSNHIFYKIKFPYLALVVSGGHTFIAEVKDFQRASVYGSTRDDSVGEAFDKIGNFLGTGYPGGPQIEKLAVKGRAEYKFTIPTMKGNPLDFSYSGLKTQVINLVRERGLKELSPVNLAHSFQECAFDIITDRIERYLNMKGKVKTLSVSGGVAANHRLREKLKKIKGIERVLFPPRECCTDNAAMIASYAYFSNRSKKKISTEEIHAFSRKDFRKELSKR